MLTTHTCTRSRDSYIVFLKGKSKRSLGEHGHDPSSIFIISDSDLFSIFQPSPSLLRPIHSSITETYIRPDQMTMHDALGSGQDQIYTSPSKIKILLPHSTQDPQRTGSNRKRCVHRFDFFSQSFPTTILFARDHRQERDI